MHLSLVGRECRASCFYLNECDGPYLSLREAIEDDVINRIAQKAGIRWLIAETRNERGEPLSELPLDGRPTPLQGFSFDMLPALPNALCQLSFRARFEEWV